MRPGFSSVATSTSAAERSPLPPIPPGGHRVQFGAPFGATAPDAIGFSDGSIRQARGTWAFVLRSPDGHTLLESSGPMLGLVRDSNVPELNGILRLLEAAEQAGVRRLVCLADSFQALQAISSGAAGRPSRYAEVLRILGLLARFDAVELRNVENRRNARADALCTLAHQSSHQRTRARLG